MYIVIGSTRIRIPVTATIVLVLLALLLSACDSVSGPEASSEATPLSLAFTSGGDGDAGESGAAGLALTDEAGNRLEIASAELLVQEVSFKPVGRGRDKVERGPFLIDLPLDASAPEVQVEMELPAGTWRAVELEIADLEDGTLDGFPEDVSIRVAGTWTPSGGASVPFTYTTDLEVEREIAFRPPLHVDDISPKNVTFLVDIGDWFRRKDRTLIDPGAEADAAAELIEENIEQSFDGYEDDDRDGDDDDDGDDDHGRQEVEGEVDQVDLDEGIVVVDGRVFHITSATRFEGVSGLGELADLVDQEVTEVEVSFVPLGNGRNLALEVEVESDGDYDDDWEDDDDWDDEDEEKGEDEDEDEDEDDDEEHNG